MEIGFFMISDEREKGLDRRCPTIYFLDEYPDPAVRRRHIWPAACFASCIPPATLPCRTESLRRQLLLLSPCDSRCIRFLFFSLVQALSSTLPSSSPMSMKARAISYCLLQPSSNAKLELASRSSLQRKEKRTREQVAVPWLLHQNKASILITPLPW